MVEATVNRLARMALAVLAVAASVFAAYHWCWRRYRCEVVKEESAARVKSAYQYPVAMRIEIARAVIPSLRQCADYDPGDFRAPFLLGSAAAAAEQNEMALSNYESALRLNERPEIYANIGLLQLELGRAEDARRNLTRAAIFNTAILASISEPLQSQLYAVARERKERLLRERERR